MAQVGAEIRFAFETTHKQPLPLPQYCETEERSSVASNAQIGWNVQRFPVKWMQLPLCLMYVEWGCTVMLNDHTLLQTTILHHCSVKWEADNSTVTRKWKWLFMNDCWCKSPNYTTTKFFNSYTHGTNSSIHLRTMLKVMTTVEYASDM